MLKLLLAAFVGLTPASAQVLTTPSGSIIVLGASPTAGGTIGGGTTSGGTVAPITQTGSAHVYVGPGKQYATIGDAFVAARDANLSDIWITVTPVPSDPTHYWDMEDKTLPSSITGRGYYGTIDQNVVLDTEPMFDTNGKRILVKLGISDATKLYYGKGIFIPYRDFSMQGFDCDGGPGGQYKQLACIRPEATAGRAQHILVQDNEFHNWANGNLGTFTSGTWIGRRNWYHHNGTGDGTEHNLYVATVDSMISDHELFEDVNVGHLFKTRARQVTITNGRFFDHPDSSTSSYGIDIPEGGVVSISNSVVMRGPNAANGPAIAVAEEIRTADCTSCGVPDDNRTRSINLSNITIVSTTPTTTPFLGTLGLWNRYGTAVSATGTKIFGPAGSRTFQMSNSTTTVPFPGDVTVLTTIPTLDYSSPIFGTFP